MMDEIDKRICGGCRNSGEATRLMAIKFHAPLLIRAAGDCVPEPPLNPYETIEVLYSVCNHPFTILTHGEAIVLFEGTFEIIDLKFICPLNRNLKFENE